MLLDAPTKTIVTSPARRSPRVIPAKPDPSEAVGMVGTATIDVAGLRNELEARLHGEVRFDDATLALYAHDASNFRQIPLGVVVPATLDDVVTTHQVCHQFGAPILNRGCGTSLSGETVNYALVIDNSKFLTRIGDVDDATGTVTVEPGAINEHVNIHTGATRNLVFGPDPSSHSRCTIGGNVGNNSCGIHSMQSQLYGPGPRTSDNVAALEVCTYDGERFWVGVNEEEHLDEIIAAGGRKGMIYARLRDLRDRYASAIRTGFPDVATLPRRVSGYNLDELLPEKGFNVARALVGTEGTCATVLQATLMLTPAMLKRTLVTVGYPSLADAGEHVPEIIDRFRPIGLEALDDQLINDQQELNMNVEDLQELPHGGRSWLLVQLGADDEATSEASAEALVEWLRDQGYADDRIAVMTSGDEGGNADDIWKIREGGLGSTAFPHGEDHWPGWEDSAVPPARVGEYVADLKALYARHGLSGAMYGHLGQGCIHSRISFDLYSPEGVRDYRAFLEEAADLVVSYGGTLSGEHGDGQQRAELLERQYGPELLAAMREFKLIWDPQWKMNPGKVIDPFRFDQDLNLGVDYNPTHPETKFTYKEDGNDFAHAVSRCVGVGKCRVPQAETTMCPSYQVTREEKHSTRGRARLLFEMLRGEIITDGWQSRDVFDALDLCLGCKGCTNDCPVSVDIPTYKAEFLYHHYKSLRRWRPRYAYAFGFIDQGARLASRFPGLVNLLTQTPGLRRVVQASAGIDPRRPLPTFAPMTLQQWWKDRGGTANPTGPPVVLFPDTFTNHLHTQVGVAGVEAIEAAGWRVIIPEGHLCCGRPLYDYGFLDAAEQYLRTVLARLRPYLRDGTPIVALEPSCLAVFRDELSKILPTDNDAERLATHVFHFAEFLERYHLEVPSLAGRALLWGHCHQRATGGLACDQKVLERMGLDVDVLTGGCCGLAGSWGFEEGKYEISMECGEQKLLPSIRDADPGTVLVANGFSCATQIADAPVERDALHLAEVIALARRGPDPSRAGVRPEDRVDRARPAPSVRRRLARAGAPMVAAAAALAVTRRRRTPGPGAMP